MGKSEDNSRFKIYVQTDYNYHVYGTDDEFQMKRITKRERKKQDVVFIKVNGKFVYVRSKKKDG